MAVNFPLFKKVAPEYSTLTQGSLSLLIAEVDREVTTSVWGEKAPLASAYLLAHMIKMTERNGRVGGVTSETVGSLSRSYGGLSTISGELDLTSYGTQFKRIRRQLVISPFVVC